MLRMQTGRGTTFKLKDNFWSQFFCCDATTKRMFLAQISVLSHQMERNKMEILLPFARVFLDCCDCLMVMLLFGASLLSRMVLPFAIK
jgi:hypothetical protein